MEIEFSVGPEDLMAFALHQRQTHKIHLRSVAVLWYLYFAALVAATVIVTNSDFWKISLLFLIFTLVFTLLQKFYVQQYFKAHYAANNVAGLIGKRKFIVLPDGFMEKSEFKETRCRWNPAIHVANTDQHIFVYLNRIQAFIIPRRAFATDQDFIVFAGELKSRARMH